MPEDTGQGTGEGGASTQGAPAQGQGQQTQAPSGKDVTIELDLIKRERDEFRSKATKYEKDIADNQRRLQELEEANTSLMKERGDKGGEKERKEYEEHLTRTFEKRYGSKFQEQEDKYKALEAEKGEMVKELNHFRVITPSMQAASKIFLPEALPLVEKEVASSCYWEEGEVRVRGADGKPVASKIDPRFYMGVEEFLQQLAKQYPMLVPTQQIQGTKDGSSASGSAMRPASSNGLPANWNSMSSNEKRAYFLANPEARKAALVG